MTAGWARIAHPILPRWVHRHHRSSPPICIAVKIPQLVAILQLFVSNRNSVVVELRKATLQYSDRFISAKTAHPAGYWVTVRTRGHNPRSTQSACRRKTRGYPDNPDDRVNPPPRSDHRRPLSVGCRADRDEKKVVAIPRALHQLEGRNRLPFVGTTDLFTGTFPGRCR